MPIEGGVDFLAHLENSKQKSKSTCHIYTYKYIYMVLNSIWQTQTYIQAQAICPIFGQILHFWLVKFLATFKVKFCSQCTMYWGGQCRNLGWWPF